jgi:NADH-quinone oxidoreductase subunit L
VLTVAAAFLTALYSWRLIIMTFHGSVRAEAEVMHHVHESPPVMTVPLILLSVGALVAGFAFDQLFIGADFNSYWRGSIVALHGGSPAEPLEHVPLLVRVVPTFFALGGIAVAYILYMFAPWIPVALARRLPATHAFFVNKWYVDELYDFLFVRPAFWLSRIGWHVIDAGIIDGVPNGAAALAASGSRQAVKLQTGSIAVYAFTMLIGVVVLVSVFLLFG